MAKIGLSDKEKVTLLGIISHPTLNDRQLSESIGIKMSTVTAIKNRLKDQGYYMTVRVPRLQRLGAELLSVTYLHTNPALPEERKRKVGRRLFEGFDELFYIGAAPRIGFALSMHRNYSTARATFDSMLRLYSAEGQLVPDAQRHVLFPFDQTKVYNFFDYSRLLGKDFRITLPGDESVAPLPPRGTEGRGIEELSRIERKVLKGLIDNPDLLDSNIAKKIDVTRQSVTKMRKKFQEQDLFFTVRVPNLELLGFEILALVHTKYMPTSTLHERERHLSQIYSDLPILFKADCDREGIEIVATRNYREFERYHDVLVTHLRETGAIDRDPTVLLFTFDEFTSIKNHVYTPALSKVIEGA